MNGKPQICILRTDGTNCDEETAHAFRLAGGEPHLVHVNELRAKSRTLTDYQVLALPGGFSYGDDVASGKILAVELVTFLGDQLREFVDAKKLVIGICNGFQVLVRTGLLPFRSFGSMQATLAHNTSGHFQCEWANMMMDHESPCVYTKDMGDLLTLQMAHGEGQFVADEQKLDVMDKDHLVPLRYLVNPNGSMRDIAGVCDPSGRIFGLMPHPERFVDITQHPNWRRFPGSKPMGLPIFQNAVKAASEL